MSDLRTLMGVAPITAAGFIGEEQAINNQTKALEQQKLQALMAKAQQEMEFDRQANPLRLAGMGLENDTKSAQIPGLRATSAQNELTLKKSQATHDSDIAKHLDANQFAMQENKIKGMQEMQKLFLTSIPEVEAAGPAGLAMLQQRFQQAGFKPEQYGPLLQRAQTAPNLSKFLNNYATRLGETAAQASAAYHQAKMEAASREKVASGNNAAVRYSADKSASSRIEVAKERGNKVVQSVFDLIRSGKIKAAEAPMALRLEAQRTADPDVKAAILEEAVKAEMYMYNRLPQARPEVDDGKIITPEKKPVMGAGAPKLQLPKGWSEVKE